jgi:hypothetical protein
MRRIAYYIACIFIGLFAARMVSAQGGHVPAAGHVLLAQAGHGRHGSAAGAAVAPVVVKATVDKQKILIGQPIQLMLEATMPAPVPGGAAPGGNAGGAGSGGPTGAGTGLIWPALDSLPHFEFVEKGKVDSTLQNGQRYFRQYMTVTSFDSGAWAIPRLPFVAAGKTIFTDSVRIEVAYTKMDPSKDYHDIKDIIDIPNPYAKWIGWIVAAVTVGSLALVIWLIRRKKKLKVSTGASSIARLSPYEEAIRQLEELERQHLPENGSVKAYYTRLSDIFRVFLSRRVGVSSLAETSEEVIGQLRRMPVAAGSFGEIAETLRMSDFVKFAKYEPGVADAEQHFRVIRGSIEAFEKAEREEEEAAASVAAARGDERMAEERPGGKRSGELPGERPEKN